MPEIAESRAKDNPYKTTLGQERDVMTPTPPAHALQPVEWRISDAPVDYETAVAEMEARVAAIREGPAGEMVWLLEHPPLYTAGTSARDEDLLDGGRFPVHKTGRGGQFTYHGPGQRVAYVMLDLKARGGDLHAFIRGLESWLMAALAQFNVVAKPSPERIGLWVERGGVDRGAYGGTPGQEDKIAAIGVRVRHGVTYHGVSVNLEPDLGHYEGIVPCGIGAQTGGVTSLHDLGILISMPELDSALKTAFAEVFGE